MRQRVDAEARRGVIMHLPMRYSILEAKLQDDLKAEKARVAELERIVRQAVKAMHHARVREHPFTAWCSGCEDMLRVMDAALEEAAE